MSYGDGDGTSRRREYDFLWLTLSVSTSLPFETCVSFLLRLRMGKESKKTLELIKASGARGPFQVDWTEYIYIHMYHAYSINIYIYTYIYIYINISHFNAFQGSYEPPKRVFHRKKVRP